MFLVNSRHPLVCATGPWLPKDRSPFSRSYGGKLPSSFNTVLSRAWVCSTSPPVSVSGTVRMRGLFPGGAQPPGQSDKPERPLHPVTTRGPRNIHLVAQVEGSLLANLREQFAEFLQHRSLKRLGILYQSTCVGLGYGLYAEAISWNAFTARAIR